MFIDARSIGEGEVLTADVCIVGGGVVGLTIAKEFRQTDFKTCIIESGGEKPDKATQALYWGENVGLPYYPLDTSRARFLGGTSSYWSIKLPGKGVGVRLRPMDPIDFEEKDWVPYSGWPFPKKHLDPYYKRAQKVCQIGPSSYDPKDWIQAGLREELPFFEDRVHTTIFQFGLRDVFLKEYVKEVKQADNTTTLLHGNVIEIETNETAKEVTRLRVVCLEGNRFWVAAKIYVLAMGGLEVPRLLLLSTNIQKSGLGNDHDLVGRFFMEHPHLWTGGFFPASVKISNSTGLYEVFSENGTHVMGKITLSENTLRKERLLNWVTSIHPSHRLSYNHYLRYDEPGVSAIRGIKHILLKRQPNKSISSLIQDAWSDPNSIFSFIYRNIKDHVKRNFSRSKHITVYRLNPMMEQAPNPESRVYLGTEKDALGQPRIKLNWQLTPLDTYTITRAMEILDEELRRANLGHLVIETKKDSVPKGIHGGWHHMGTTRMHSDPKHGVVDSNCRVHGISNLYIGGGSTFPTSGYANPVLTTIALAIRLADHIAKIMNA